MGNGLAVAVNVVGAGVNVTVSVSEIMIVGDTVSEVDIDSVGVIV